MFNKQQLDGFLKSGVITQQDYEAALSKLPQAAATPAPVATQPFAQQAAPASKPAPFPISEEIAPIPEPSFFERNIASPFANVLGEAQETIASFTGSDSLMQSAAENKRAGHVLAGGKLRTGPAITAAPEDTVTTAVGKTVRNIPNYYEARANKHAFFLADTILNNPLGRRLGADKAVAAIVDRLEDIKFTEEEINSTDFIVNAAAGVTRAIAEMPMFMALGPIGAVGDVGASSYSDARMEGFSKLEAAGKGGLNAIAVGVMQKRLDLFGALVRGKGSRFMAGVKEGVEEMGEEAADITGDKVFLGKDLGSIGQVMERMMLALTVGTLAGNATRKAVDALSKGEPISEELQQLSIEEVHDLAKAKTTKQLAGQLRETMDEIDKRGDVERQINELTDKAINDKDSKDIVFIGKVSEMNAKMLQEKTGLDFTGFVRTIDADHIRHALIRHGNDKVPVTVNDFQMIPKIFAEPDEVYLSKKLSKSRKKPVLIYKKQLGDNFYFAEEIYDTTKDGKLKRLSVMTLAKSPGKQSTPLGEREYTIQDFENTLEFEESQETGASMPSLETTPGLTSETIQLSNNSTPKIHEVKEGDVPDGRLHKTAIHLIQTQREKDLANKGFAFYDPKSRKPVRDMLEEGPDAQLETVFRDKKADGDDRAVAGIMLYKRLNDGGKDADHVLEELFDMGLQAGRIISAFNELKGASPEFAVKAIEKQLAKKQQALNPTERADMLEMAKRQIEASNAARDAYESYRKNRTDENAQLADEAELRARKLARDFSKATSGKIPNNTLDVLATVLQGNLLTPKSLAANVIGNIVNMPARASAKTIASILSDEVNVSLVEDTKATFAGLGKALPEVAQIFTPGGALGDKVAGEDVKRLQPVRSMIQALSGKDLVVDPATGKPTLKTRASKFIEGAFGMPAEIMFRGLQAGDIPFKFMARERLLREQARLRGLTGDEAEAWMRNPDKATRDQIEYEVLTAVFQQSKGGIAGATSTISRALDRHPASKFLSRNVAPYRITPVNVALETADYMMPELSLTQMLYHAKQGDERQAALYFGKAMTGYALSGVAKMLVMQGLASFGWQPDESKEANQIRISNMGHNKLNTSGIQRYIEAAKNGASPEELDAATKFKEGDQTIEYKPLGIFGAMLMLYSDLHKKGNLEEFDEKEGSFKKQAIDMMTRAGGVTQAVYEQSFMKGVQGMFKAMEDGSYDSMAANMFRTVVAIPIPATWSAAMKMERDFIPEQSSVDIGQKFSNILADKMWWSNSMNNKLDVLGRPIKQTPDGAGHLTFNLLNPFKTRTGGNDPILMEMERLYNATGDSSVVATPPGRVFQFQGTKYELNDDQLHDLQVRMGAVREQYIKKNVIESKTYESRPDEVKAALWKKIYSESSDSVRRNFFVNNASKLKPMDEESLEVRNRFQNREQNQQGIFPAAKPAPLPTAPDLGPGALDPVKTPGLRNGLPAN